MRRVAQLYAIEQDAASLTPAGRRAMRQERAVPTLAELHAWLLATQRTVAVGSGTGKAIEHALKRWPVLVRYATSGILPIDNNPVANAIRPIAIGNNYLFVGAERAAAIYGLIGTANFNGVDPEAWLGIDASGTASDIAKQ